MAAAGRVWVVLLAVKVGLGGAMVIASPLSWVAVVAERSSGLGARLWCRSLDWVAPIVEWRWRSLRRRLSRCRLSVQFVVGLGVCWWQQDGMVVGWFFCRVVDMGVWLRLQGWRRWGAGDWQGWVWRGWAVVMVRSRFGKGKTTASWASTATRVLGCTMVVPWCWKAIHGLFFVFLRVFFFCGLGTISPYSVELGFGLVCWLRLMCPYSFKLGLGLMVVPWLWRLSWGLIVSFLVCCCGQFADERFLHVVWFVWIMVFEWDGCLSGSWYAAVSKFSGIFLVACGRVIGLGVGPFRLMDVITVYDGPVTIVLDWNVCSGIGVTTGHSVAL